MDGLEPLERLQEDPIPPDSQVAPFDQGDPKVPSEVGVFEPGFMHDTWRQQHDPRVFAHRRPIDQPPHQGTIARRQSLHPQGSKCGRKLPRDDDPVFQQIPQARR